MTTYEIVNASITGYTVLTHDYRRPFGGGEPLWDGVSLPHALPPVVLDGSMAECDPGYHYCATPAQALANAGLWAGGRPVCVVEVAASPAGLTITRRLAVPEIRAAVAELSRPFGAHADAMVDAQMEWFEALGRPYRDEQRVRAALHAALAESPLPWTVRRSADAREAWDARAVRDAWDTWDARDARDVWDTWAARDVWGARAVWEAWDARAVRDAWGARDVWEAWEAWDARAVRDAWDTWAARAARDALTWRYAALMGWVDGSPERLTIGRVAAYRYGAAIVVPTGPNELGFAMEEAS